MAYKGKSKEVFTVSELKKMFYDESIHVCNDENEASLLSISALNDFLNNYSNRKEVTIE